MTITTHYSVNRLVTIGALALACAVAASCKDFLVADNPGAVQVDDVNNPAYINLIAAGPIATFQFAWAENTYWNGQLSDELFNRATFIEEGQIDRREMYSDMSYINAFMYAPMQRARYVADDAAARLKILLADSASRDLRVSRALAYAGYGYIGLAEMMCIVPIDLGAPKQPEEAFTDAIARFNEAITIGKAYKAYQQTLNPVVPGNLLAADSVINFALVGAARAALNKNDKPAAINFASQVPADFNFVAYYNTDNSAQQRNRVYERIGNTGTNSYLINTPFFAMAGDPRVPRVAGTTGRGGTPLSPPSYSTFTNTVAGGPFASIMFVRVASGLEARYIVAEASGPTAATLAFVNERRAAGLQAPVNLSGAELMAELRDQRSRDFYLDNHRLGDLRRYQKYYNVDLFPKGPYPGSTTGQVYSELPNTLTTANNCWPLPTNEINGNPNIPKG
jgi:hypothetical protein